MSQDPHTHQQHIPACLAWKNQNADKSDDKPLEQHLFVTAVGATVETDAIIHLGSEGVSKMVVKQVAFGDASNMHIIGGFFGAGSPSVAKQIAANHLQRRMTQDSAMMRLETERLEIQRRQLELAERRLQCESGNNCTETNRSWNATSG